MDNVRIGIIGIGGMGSNHAGYLRDGAVPQAELAAVCDINPERIAWARENLPGVKTFDTADELFAADVVDGVMIATPHYFHPPLAVQAFDHGLHVLSEKPAGVYTGQVQEMNAAAAKSGKVFGIMFNQRTLGVHQKMRDLVQSGELGPIQRTNWVITTWFRTQSYYDSGGWRATWEGEGGGVLLNQCPHQLDLWQWIAGMPTRVRAFCSFGKYHDVEVEDEVTAYVEYDNGATGLFVTTTGEAPGSNRFEVVGDRGKMVLEHGELKLWQNRETTSTFLRESKQGFAKPECWECKVPTGQPGEQHQGITKNWVQAISRGTPLLGPGEEGIHGLEISNAMLMSAWTGDWVDIPVDADAFHDLLKQRIDASTTDKQAGAGKVMDVDGTFQ